MKLNKNNKYVGAVIKDVGVKVVLPITCIALLVSNIYLYKENISLKEEVELWKDGVISQTSEITRTKERIAELEAEIDFAEGAQQLLIDYINDKIGDDVVIYEDPTLELIENEDGEVVDSRYIEKPKIWVRRLPGEKIQ